MKKLSSNLTCFYKYVIPLFFLLIIMISCIGVIANLNDIDIMMPFVLNFVGFSIFLLFCNPLLKLKNIYYNEDITVIIDKGIIKRFNNIEIKSVKRYYFYFFRIEFKDSSKKRFFLFRAFLKFFLVLNSYQRV